MHSKLQFSLRDDSKKTADKATELDTQSPSKNAQTSSLVSDILQILAFGFYVAAAIAAIVSFCSGESLSGFVALLSGLASGTIFLGFAETIMLLHQINNKLK